MSSVSAIAKSQAAPGLDLERCAEAVAAAERLLHLAKSGVRKAVDAAGSLVYFAPSLINLRLVQEKWSDVAFAATREHLPLMAA